MVEIRMVEISVSVLLKTEHVQVEAEKHNDRQRDDQLDHKVVAEDERDEQTGGIAEREEELR